MGRLFQSTYTMDITDDSKIKNGVCPVGVKYRQIQYMGIHLTQVALGYGGLSDQFDGI